MIDETLMRLSRKEMRGEEYARPGGVFAAPAEADSSDMDLSDASLRLRVIEILCAARNVTPDGLIQTADAVVQYVASGTVPGRPIVGADGMDSHG